MAYTYDNLDRVTEVKASKDGTSYTIGRYIYDKLGRVARFVDGQVSEKSCTYGYDLTDRLCEAIFDDGTAYRYTYDANDCLVKEVQTTPAGVRTVTRGYDADSRETSVTCGSAKIEKTFDKLGRLSSIKRNSGKHTTVFQYMKAPDGGETGRVASIKNSSDAISYGYDKRGYVTSATNESTAWKYHYDASGQLIREENPVQRKTFVYQYDEGGNLLEVKSYPMTDSAESEGSGTVEKTFTYGSTWKDQLAAVTMDGKTRTFTYDANGNMLSDGKYTYSWTKGSLLEKVTGNGLEAVYTYDASGIRTSKKVNGTTTEYLTAGGSVLGEKKNGVWQYYLYDGDGQLFAISYKGSDYYYIRDNLRAITGLVDANGAAVVNYRYDNWGRMLDITGSMAESLGKDNPYRYKGYCYDEETGMYYLKSRYYAPEICRFISADDISAMLDSPMSLWDKNLYVYCDNDPVNKKDDDGEIADFVAMGIIGAVANVGISFITAKMLGQDYGWQNVLEDSISGALCAIPAISMISNSEKYLKRAGQIIMVGKAAWLAISGYLKGYSLKKTALYMGVNLWLESPNFSGIVDPKIPEELIKQIGRNLVYELGFSSLRTGVNTGFDIASGNNNSKKKGNQSNKKNKSSNKWTPPANSGYKNKNGVVLIPSPIDYIINMSQLKR